MNCRTIKLKTVQKITFLPEVRDTMHDIINGELPAVEILAVKFTDSTNFADLEDCEILKNMLLFMLQAEVNYGHYCVDCTAYTFGESEHRSPCDDSNSITASIIYSKC